jgi:hypothetical protein
MTEPCIGCGGNKELTHSEPYAVWWKCELCGVSCEEVIESETPC